MLRVKRLSSHATIPTVAHPGEDLAYDLYSDCNVNLYPGMVTQVGTGIAAVFGDGYYAYKYGLLIRDRSSMAAKGIMSSGGVIDAGYRGEIVVMLTLLDGRAERHTILKGDKIAQMIPMPVFTSDPIVEVDELPETKRSDKGFGSSGR